MNKVFGWLIALTVGLALFAPGTAQAHSGDQALVYLDVSSTSLAGRAEFPVGDLREVLDFALDTTDDDVKVAEVTSRIDELHAWIDEHLDFGVDGQNWPIEFSDDVEFLFDEDDGPGNYLLVPFEVQLPTADVPQNFEVMYDPFFDEIEGRDALLLIANDWDRGVFENEGESLVTFDADSRTRNVDLGEGGWWKNFSASVQLGVDHIRTGPDHIFFVFVLLMPSVLIFSAKSWHPVDGFGSSLWRVLKLVTMFTIAHSITFTLAGLDFLPLPSSKLTEAIIALSIVAAALNNIWPVAPNKEWLIAGSFGLFHGMGFASLVSDLDVSRSTELVSLLGRNVGIEIGQAVVVLVTFPLLFLLRRTIYYRPLFIASSATLAIVATLWMYERLFEKDLGFNGLVDRVLQWPRSLVVVAIITAIAAGLFKMEQSRNRLIPVAIGDDGSDTFENDPRDDESILV